MFHRGGVLWDTICVAFLLGIPLLPDWVTVGDTLVVEVPGVVFGAVWALVSRRALLPAALAYPVAVAVKTCPGFATAIHGLQTSVVAVWTSPPAGMFLPSIFKAIRMYGLRKSLLGPPDNSHLDGCWRWQEDAWQPTAPEPFLVGEDAATLKTPVVLRAAHDPARLYVVLDGDHSLIFHTHNWSKHDPDQGYMPDATPARDGYEGPLGGLPLIYYWGDYPARLFVPQDAAHRALTTFHTTGQRDTTLSWTPTPS